MSKHLEVIANHPILRAYPITRQNKTNQTPVREGLFWVYLVKVVPIKVSPFWTQQREASIMDWFMSSALPCSSADFPSTDADASPSRTSRFRASFCFRRSLTEALKPLIFSFETKRVGRSHRTLLNSRVGSTIGYISWLIAGWTVGLMIDISHYVSWELSGYKVIHQQTFHGGGTFLWLTHQCLWSMVFVTMFWSSIMLNHHFLWVLVSHHFLYTVTLW